MIFHWDMAIYRFSKWRPSGILELFHHYTRPPRSLCCWPQLPVKFHVNLIHRSEDIAIWIFSRIWLEMPIQAPKIGVLEDFEPLNVIIYHQDHQKTHPCVNPRLLGYQLSSSSSFSLIISWQAQPVHNIDSEQYNRYTMEVQHVQLNAINMI